MTRTFETIRFETADGVARITLNRPEKLNAISATMLRELHDALWDADDDTSVHCVVLAGEGRAFCAGYDLSPLQQGGEDPVERRGSRSFDDDTWQMERSQRLRMALFDMHKPVIAQVHGYCLAGGTDLATLCDMLICADDARFGFPPGRDLGVLPTQMWLYHVGPQWAKRLLMTGDTVYWCRGCADRARSQVGARRTSSPPRSTGWRAGSRSSIASCSQRTSGRSTSDSS